MQGNKEYGICHDASERIKTDRRYIGIVLRNARKSNNMTQQQVANTAGIALRHYQMFENGEREIINATFRVAMSVIKTLDINPEHLLHNGICVPDDTVEKEMKK